MINRRPKPPIQEMDNDGVIDDTCGYPLPVVFDECFRCMVRDA
jgi:hypothetical protein